MTPFFIRTLYILLLFSSFSSRAQYTLLGADGFGRGNALVASSGFSSIYINPAGIANLKENFAAANYYRQVPVEGFNTLGISAAYKYKNVHLGFSTDSFGDRDYHESRIGAALAIKKDKVALGVKFSYLNNAIAEVSSKQAVLGEFGILVDLSKKVNLGMRVSNFTRARLYESQYLPTLIALGIEYRLSSAIIFNSEVDYLVSENAVFKAGLSYKFSESFTVNTGVSPYLKALHFGLEFNSKPWCIQLGAVASSAVGISKQVSLIRAFGK
jgi:hypothetical protein